jgi:hypothetical protein
MDRFPIRSSIQLFDLAGVPSFAPQRTIRDSIGIVCQHSLS